MRIDLVCLLVLCCSAACAAESDERQQREFFEAKIRPIFVAHCHECHAADSKQIGGELLLDSRDGLLKGGESGAVISPGVPEESLLLEAVRYESFEMPPKGKLPDHVIADLEQWIRMGAFDPRVATPKPPTRREIDVEEGREFWSFQPPRSHPAPAVANRAWPRRKADTFVLAQLEERGLRPARRAKRDVLARRLSFDLTGLPPDPRSVEHFVTDNRPDAYERYVERLLAAPQFGERWARLWLDVARYAEDQAHIVGNNDSLFYPNAYLYREWLIKALNSDLPYDDFIKRQLAADVLDPEAKSEHVALGFLGLGPKYYRRNAPEVMADEWEDRIDTVTRGLLGLTVACARCHDHKYDPIPTEDYYALAGVFASTEMFNRPLDPQADASKQAKKAAEAVHIVREGKPRDLPVYIRGDAFNKADKVVPRRFLQVLSTSPIALRDGSGRAQLANAIAREENPLTARVIVNRIWGQYFGKSLVDTPSNFGNLGSRPTHPQLLDDLAVRFMRAGWSLKWLHREIVYSSAYQQASTATAETMAIDPANRWLSRMSRRRLSIEMWRDAMLQATGELREQVGGKSLQISDPKATRRSVYSYVSRLELNRMQQMFDFPDPNAHAALRSETTTPLQKLFMLNSDFMLARANQLVRRIEQEGVEVAKSEKINRVYEIVLGRQPTDEEAELALDYLRSSDHWPRFAQVLFASNEMIHLD